MMTICFKNNLISVSETRKLLVLMREILKKYRVDNQNASR